MRTKRCCDHGRAPAGHAMDPVRRLVAAYEASTVLLRELDGDDEDRDVLVDREIDRDFVASSWSAPRRRHRIARRGGR